MGLVMLQHRHLELVPGASVMQLAPDKGQCSLNHSHVSIVKCHSHLQLAPDEGVLGSLEDLHELVWRLDLSSGQRAPGA